MIRKIVLVSSGNCVGILVLLLSIILLPVRISAQEQLDADTSKVNEYLEEIFKKITDPEAATAAFYKKLEVLNHSTINQGKSLVRLHADIIDIMDEKEKEQWKNLQTPEEKIRFVKRFWISHDVTPATLVNERLNEHYTRLLYARAHFSWPNLRGYDDRGRIYIQYGPPDNWIDDASNAGALPVLSWVYFRHGPSISFDFLDKGLGYELTTDLTKAIVSPGIISYVSAAEKLVTRRASASPEYMRLNNELNPIFEILRIAPGRLQADPLNYRNKVERAFDNYTVDIYKRQAVLPKTTSEVSVGQEELTCALNLAQFKGENGEPDLLAMYGFRISDLKNKSDTTCVKIIATVRDTALNIRTSHDTVYTVFQNQQPPSEDFIAATTYRLPQGKYYFLLEADNSSGRQHGMRDFSFRLSDYPKGELHLSSAIFAKAVYLGDSTTFPLQAIRRHHLAITPYPFPALNRHVPLFVYFEIYDLQRDTNGETFYQIEYEVNVPEKKGFVAFLANLNPFSKDGGRISVADLRHGKATMEPTYLQLNFGQLRHGQYELIVRVTDKLMNATKESKLEFELEER